MHSHKILKISPTHTSQQDILSKELKISKILAQILINRGICTKEEAHKFLNLDLRHLLDPYSFADMQKAVALIKDAAIKKEKIMVFGDYDVDGITAVTLLKDALAKIGVEPLHYIPHRIKEGYGLTKNILHTAEGHKVKLLITADCGTSSHEQIKELRRNNVEVIITDHHEPSTSQMPDASAIINPKIKGSGYKYRELAGVGVAYKLCQALLGKNLEEDLDLVCLGTIADVVPLLVENRIFAKEGLKRLSKTKRAGLQALMKTSGIDGKDITPMFVSYIIGPRINASGRMATADISLNLLTTKDKNEADKLARIVETYNRDRQKIEGKILEEAQDLIDKEINFKEHRVIVIAQDGWHQGVLGVVASKLADKFYRPTILISLTEDLCKGSGRSIKNFHLFEALSECRDFLRAFGGHSHAVGLLISREHVNNFRVNINRLAKEKLMLEDLLPSLEIDMELELKDLTDKLAQELFMLEPYGAGNPEPLFYTRDLKLKSEPQVLSRDTLKFWVTDGIHTCQAIGFGMGGFKESLMDADRFDLIYVFRQDNWQGRESVILEIKDIFFKQP